MSNILLLTKLLFKTRFTAASKAKGKSNKNQTLLLIVLGIILLVTYAFPFGAGSVLITQELAKLSLADVILELVFPAVTSILIIFSVMTIISYYYLSTDIQTLLSLPLKPKDILLARFILVVMSLYLIEAFFVAPIVIGYGIGMGSGFSFYLIALLVLLLLPIIPVALMSIIITTLMRVSHIKSKDSLTYVVLVLSLGIGVGFSVATNYFTNMSSLDPEQINQITSLVARATNYVLPFLRPAINAISQESYLYLLLYIAISAFSVWLFLLIADRIYLKAVMGSGENKSKVKKELHQKERRFKGVGTTYALKEWRIMFRTPIYNINLIMVNLVMLVMIGIGLASGLSAGEEADFAAILSFRLDGRQGYLFFYILAACTFLFSTNFIASTAISRDGESAWYMKIIPVAPIKQITYKIFFAIVVNASLPVLLMIAAVCVQFITPLDAIMLLVPIMLMIIYVSYFGVLIDLARPKLHWDNETEAVKQNFNGVIYMIFIMLLTLLLVLLALVITLKTEISDGMGRYPFLATLIVGGVLLLFLAAIFYQLSKKKTASLFTFALLQFFFGVLALVGVVAIVLGILEMINETFYVGLGIYTWAILVSLVLGSLTVILYKSVKAQGDSILKQIE